MYDVPIDVNISQGTPSTEKGITSQTSEVMYPQDCRN